MCQISALRFMYFAVEAFLKRNHHDAGFNVSSNSVRGDLHDGAPAQQDGTKTLPLGCCVPNTFARR
jgi:hypothetical protein